MRNIILQNNLHIMKLLRGNIHVLGCDAYSGKH